MSKKCCLLLWFIVLSIGLASCGSNTVTEKDAAAGTVKVAPAATNAPAGTGEGQASSSMVAINEEASSRALPADSLLSVFPGVLQCMTLPIDQILEALGNNYEHFENTAQGYDVYQFDDKKLVLEYDRMSDKLSTIWLNGVPYYVYSGTFTSSDIDGDGADEFIAAYEDDKFSGHVVVFTPDGLIKADQVTDSFPGQCTLSVLSDYGAAKESLVILDTRSEKDCEVFSYQKGKLIIMSPPIESIPGDLSNVVADQGSVRLTLEDKGMTYSCPVPEAFTMALSHDIGELPGFQFVDQIMPFITQNSLSLLVRQSLQMKIYDDSGLVEGAQGIYADIAQILHEYTYVGEGKWELVSTKGGPKYDAKNFKDAVSSADMRLGQIGLNEKASTIAELPAYTENDLISGVLFKKDDICVGITDQVVSYLSLEKNSTRQTSRGLKVTDTKDQALSLYGLPDKGYYEDSIWTYYCFREQQIEETAYLLADSFNIEFEGDKVSKIWLSTYLSSY